MRRRDFVTLLGGAAAGIWPPVAYAQRNARTPRLGVLLHNTPQTDPNIESFLRGLRDLGYVEGQNLAIEYRFAEGKSERLPELAADLVRLNPDAILAFAGDVAPHAVKATRTIPIVFTSSADPVQGGLVASLARPGGNATGVTYLLDELASKRLEIFKEAVPNISRTAFIYNPIHIDHELREAERAAAVHKITLQPVEVRRPSDLEGVFDTIMRAGADSIYVVSSRATVTNVRRIMDFANKNRLPVAGGWGAWSDAGALISYGPNVGDLVRRTVAAYVDRILKGTKPADLPVQQPTRFELLVNLKAAKALGLSILESFLMRADRVIE